MTISRTTQHQLAKGDFDAVESDWLTRLEQDVTDLDYFVGVARALSGNAQDDRARPVLQLRAGELGRNPPGLRLKLLRRGGDLLFANEKLYPAIVSTLKRLYGDRSTFKGLFEAAGIARATHDLPKIWEKVERLEGLLA